MGGNGCNKNVAPGGEFVAGGSGTPTPASATRAARSISTRRRGAVLVGAVSRGVDGSSTPCGGGGIYVRTDKISSGSRRRRQDDREGRLRRRSRPRPTRRAPDDGEETVGCDDHGGAGLGAGRSAAALRRRRRRYVRLPCKGGVRTARIRPADLVRLMPDESGRSGRRRSSVVRRDADKTSETVDSGALTAAIMCRRVARGC